MPFMIGPGPIRRTLDYLKSGRLRLLDSVKILTINYNSEGDRHKGAREFAFWELPRLQYGNPNVQMATFVNASPVPFVRCYFEDGRSMIVDADAKSQADILEHLIDVVGKTQTDIAAETHVQNPANFGVGCERPCMCEVRGQVPCSGVVPLPKHMRGKYAKKTD